MLNRWVSSQGLIGASSSVYQLGWNYLWGIFIQDLKWLKKTSGVCKSQFRPRAGLSSFSFEILWLGSANPSGNPGNLIQLFKIHKSNCQNMYVIFTMIYFQVPATLSWRTVQEQEIIVATNWACTRFTKLRETKNSWSTANSTIQMKLISISTGTAATWHTASASENSISDYNPPQARGLLVGQRQVVGGRWSLESTPVNRFPLP